MKKNKNQRFILVLMLLVIIALAIVLVVYAISQLNKNKSNTITQTEGEFSVTTEAKQSEEKHVQVLDNGTKLNTSTKLHEEKSVDGFTFSNFQLTTTDGLTTLIANVTNNSNSDKPITAFDLIFIDDAGKELVKFGGFINATKAGETTKLTSSGTLDYANAYDLKIIKK